MNKNKKYKKNMKRQRQLRNNVRTVEMWLQKKKPIEDEERSDRKTESRER